MSAAAESGYRRLVVLGGAALVALFALFAASAVRANAAELLYWNNYGAKPQTISAANASGSGGLLNLTGVDLKSPEGMAIDSVTARLYVAASSAGPDESGQIQFANLDGSGAGVFSAPGAPVDSPYGVAVDPTTRTIYWANASGGTDDKGTIAWARLDGSVGGTINTAGATLVDPYKVGLDPVNGRIYWGSYITSTETVISYANLNNSGGGDLPISPPASNVYAFAVDPAAGRLYWSEGNDNRFAYTGLLGGTHNTLDTGGAVVNTSYGFAIDPTLNKISWPNYDNEEDPVNGLGFASLSGGAGGNITPTAPFDEPQDLVVLKSPTGTGAPTITRSSSSPAALSCSPGTWAADFAGSFVYQAPHTIAYQWTVDGAPVQGASAATFAAITPGSYGCVTTATNQAGSASQTSAAATAVKAAKLKLSAKKKQVQAKPGKTATFKVNIANQGDFATGKSAKLCVKGAKKAIKSKCAKVSGVKSLAKKVAKLKVKVKPTAQPKTYSLKIAASGVSSKPLKVKLKVLG